MTGVFQKVNHLGKSELTGSAGSAIEKGKIGHLPPFPKAEKLRALTEDRQTKHYNKVRETKKTSFMLTLPHPHAYRHFSH